MECANCGAALRSTAKVCIKCGVPVGVAAVKRDPIADAPVVQHISSPVEVSTQSRPTEVNSEQQGAPVGTLGLGQRFQEQLPAMVAKHARAFEAAPGFDRLPKGVDTLVLGAAQEAKKYINPRSIVRHSLIGWGINAALVAVTIVAVGVAAYSLLAHRAGNMPPQNAPLPVAPAGNPAPPQVSLPNINIAPTAP